MHIEQSPVTTIAASRILLKTSSAKDIIRSTLGQKDLAVAKTLVVIQRILSASERNSLVPIPM